MTTTTEPEAVTAEAPEPRPDEILYPGPEDKPGEKPDGTRVEILYEEPEPEAKPETKPETKVEATEPEPQTGQETKGPDLYREDVEAEAVIKTGREVVAELDRRIAAAEQQLAALGPDKKNEAAALRQELLDAKRKRAQYAETVEHEAAAYGARVLSRQLEQGKAALSKVFGEIDRKALRTYLTSNPDAKFTTDEVNMAYDHRLVVLAEKARRYDELMAGRKTVIPQSALKPRKGRPKPKVAKPDRPLTVSEMFKEAGKPTAADILYG